MDGFTEIRVVIFEWIVLTEVEKFEEEVGGDGRGGDKGWCDQRASGHLLT